MSSKLRKIARAAALKAKSEGPTPEGDRASTLIARIHQSGLLRGYSYSEIVTAALNISAQSLHEQAGLSAEVSLRKLGEIAGVMADQETETGWLQLSWEKSN